MEFFHEYGIAAWVFAILSGTVCFYLIEFVNWLTFILRSHRRIRFLNVNCLILRDDSNYPCKLCIQFKNWTNQTVLVRLEGFELGGGIRPDKNADRDSTSGLIEVKFIENASQQPGLLLLNIDAIIRHAETKTVWVPLDPDQAQSDL